MGWHAIAFMIRTAFLAAIIAAIPSAQVVAQPNPPTPSPSAPDVSGGGDSPSARPESAPSLPSSDLAPATMAPARLIEVTDAPGPRHLVASLSHELQFGLAVLLGDGYRGVIPYGPDIDCGDAKSLDNRVCTNRAPVFLDLQPSYGLSERWDVLVDLRLGLTRDFNTFHQFFVMPGFRYWLDPQSQVKFFSTLQLAYDRSNQNNHAGAVHVVSDTDLGFRNSNGVMVEVMRNLGVYFQFGETLGLYRGRRLRRAGPLALTAPRRALRAVRAKDRPARCRWVRETDEPDRERRRAVNGAAGPAHRNVLGKPGSPPWCRPARPPGHPMASAADR